MLTQAKGGGVVHLLLMPLHCALQVHASRTLSRLARTATVGDEQFLSEFRVNIGRLLRAHAIAQRHSVRGTEKETLTELDPLVLPEEMAELNKAKKNLPLVLLVHLGIEIAKYKDHVKHIKVFEEMDHMVDNLMEAWMGMHKLATTPMPFPFIQMLLGLMYLWIYTVPFPLANLYGWAAPPITMLFGTAFFGINAIGAELEDPLGEETNDLPLDVYEKAALQASMAMKLGFPEATRGQRAPTPADPSNGPQSAVMSQSPAPIAHAKRYWDRDLVVLKGMTPEDGKASLEAMTMQELAGALASVKPEEKAAALTCLEPAKVGAALVATTRLERSIILPAMKQEARTAALAAMAPDQRAMVLSEMSAEVRSNELQLMDSGMQLASAIAIKHILSPPNSPLSAKRDSTPVL